MVSERVKVLERTMAVWASMTVKAQEVEEAWFASELQQLIFDQRTDLTHLLSVLSSNDSLC